VEVDGLRCLPSHDRPRRGSAPARSPPRNRVGNHDRGYGATPWHELIEQGPQVIRRRQDGLHQEAVGAGRAMALEHLGELCHQRLDLLVVDAGFLTRYIPMISRDREESLVNKVDEAIEIEPRKTDRRVDAPVGKVVVTQSRF
jgi:hypothetical protein